MSTETPTEALDTLTPDDVLDQVVQLDTELHTLRRRVYRLEFDTILCAVAAGLAFALAIEALRVSMAPRVIRSVMA